MGIAHTGIAAYTAQQCTNNLQTSRSLPLRLSSRDMTGDRHPRTRNNNTRIGKALGRMRSNVYLVGIYIVMGVVPLVLDAWLHWGTA
eukprot:2226251-Rhodomonas_salina.2